jgi:hypothetical protein
VLSVCNMQMIYTIFFVDKSGEKAENLKWILNYFELMSGMRVNYRKSEIVPTNIERREEIESFAMIFGCPVGKFPIKYLVIPLHHNKLRREDLQPLLDKIIKRIAR